MKKMLIFLDESFRERQSKEFGTLAGLALDEKRLTSIAQDIFHLKHEHFGADYARDGELKGKDLLKRYAFRLEEHKGIQSKNLDFSRDLVRYINKKKLFIFGCVCFDPENIKFNCPDTDRLPKTYRYLFERLDMFMKIERKDEMASIVFDDRDHGTNLKNATAITNYFLRSPDGLALDSIIDTPFFAISQAQNIGLQLADFVTTIIAMRFEGRDEIKPIFTELKKSIYSWKNDSGYWQSGLKVIRT